MELIPSLLLQARLKFPSSPGVPHYLKLFSSTKAYEWLFAASPAAVLGSTGLIRALESPSVLARSLHPVARLYWRLFDVTLLP